MQGYSRLGGLLPGKWVVPATQGAMAALLVHGTDEQKKTFIPKMVTGQWAGTMKLSDIDLFELNEAFASVVLRYQQAFDIDSSKINVNGGAIALGHPLGATGAMILGTVLDELERTNKSTALVTLCIGGGMLHI